MTVAGPAPSRALVLACDLVARLGPDGARAAVAARISAGLNALCDAKYRTLYGDGPRGKRPVGLTS